MMRRGRLSGRGLAYLGQMDETRGSCTSRPGYRLIALDAQERGAIVTAFGNRGGGSI